MDRVVLQGHRKKKSTTCAWGPMLSPNGGTRHYDRCCGLAYFLKMNVGVARYFEVSHYLQVSPVLSLSPHKTIL